MPPPAPSTWSIMAMRVILDGTASATDDLELIASLPMEFSGDVVLIREDGGAFINATGNGSGRVVYSLAPRDLTFYLQIHGMLENGRLQLVPQAPHFQHLLAA